MPFLRPALGVATLTLSLSAALLAQTPDSSLLTLDRIFDSDEFAPEPSAAVRWLAGEAAYTSSSPTARPRAPPRSCATTPPAAAARSGCPAARLVPAGRLGPARRSRTTPSRPTGSGCSSSPTRGKVWRQNTRGDFWALDLGHLARSGSSAARPRRRPRSCSPSSRPTAGGSPTCASTTSTSRTSPTAAITRLTRDGSRTIINGTFDWVYEEELNLRDGFRWSPDGRRIAFWQLDASGVRDFDLINDTDSLYSFVVPVQYPKAGTTNSAGARRRGERRRRRARAGSTSPATRATTTSRGWSGRRARTRWCSST